MPLVSVVVPYYKKKKFIKKCIDSILFQTYQNIEIIIIYDDEELQDLDFIKHLFIRSKKIKLIVNKKNKGAGLSRNTGIKYSKGEYIAFCDADDFWRKDKIETQLNFMMKNQFLLTHTSYKIIDLNGKVSQIRKAKKLNYNDILYACDIGLSTVMVHKSVFSDSEIVFPNLITKEDFVLWLKILKKYKCYFYNLNETLTYWTTVENSLSSATFQKILDAYKVYRIYCKFGYLRSLFGVFLLSKNYLIKKICKI